RPTSSTGNDALPVPVTCVHVKPPSVEWYTPLCESPFGRPSVAHTLSPLAGSKITEIAEVVDTPCVRGVPLSSEIANCSVAAQVRPASAERQTPLCAAHTITSLF